MVKAKCLRLCVIVLCLVASLLRIAEQSTAKEVEIRAALLHVSRFPMDYVTQGSVSQEGTDASLLI